MIDAGQFSTIFVSSGIHGPIECDTSIWNLSDVLARYANDLAAGRTL